MRTDYIRFLESLAHVPEHKRKASEELALMYENWRASGGVPTVITRELMRTRGMKKLSRSVPLIGDKPAGSYVIGKKQPRMRFDLPMGKATA